MGILSLTRVEASLYAYEILLVLAYSVNWLFIRFRNMI